MVEFTKRIKERDQIDAHLLQQIAHAEEMNVLTAWNQFSSTVHIPADLYIALQTGREELLRLTNPRPLSEVEARATFHLIGTLIRTNMLLREHAERTSQMVDTWAQAFNHLHSVGQRVQNFAAFRASDQEREPQ